MARILPYANKGHVFSTLHDFFLHNFIADTKDSCKDGSSNDIILYLSAGLTSEARRKFLSVDTTKYHYISEF